MAQVLNGLRSGSKDEVLTSAHQRHAQCPTYILAIFSRYEKKDADLPGSPPVKKEKKDKTDKRKGEPDESAVAEVPKSKKSKKNK